MSNEFILVSDDGDIFAHHHQRSTRWETRRAGVYYSDRAQRCCPKKRGGLRCVATCHELSPIIALDGQAERKPKSTTRNSQQIRDPIYLPYSSDGGDDKASHQRSRIGSCRVHHNASTTVHRCVQDRPTLQHSCRARAPRQPA